MMITMEHNSNNTKIYKEIIIGTCSVSLKVKISKVFVLLILVARLALALLP